MSGFPRIQADALQAYQDARRELLDGLGLEPGRALQALERAILAHDMHGSPTAWARFILRLYNDFFPRKVGRQRAAIDRSRFCARR